METMGTNQPILDPYAAAELARVLHDSPGGFLGREPVPVHAFAPGASLRERRESFAEVYGTIVARIGEPTLYGGSAYGPNVRWRSAERTVLLHCAGHWALLSAHHTESLESAEDRSFAWSGPWAATEPHEFDLLPYVWQLDRGGPGEQPSERPAGRMASCLEHFEAALELTLAAWVEQLPVQVGGDWAGFTLTSSADRGRRLQVSYALEDGLHVSVDDRDGEDTPERSSLMRARGWQSRDRGWWQAEFPAPERPETSEAARLTLTELRARGTRAPKELRARDVSCKDRGELLLPGLGIRH
ncbi:hypothetical protein [Streptomyces sp. NPDC048057]|uniref:hypothetical protein n=1 Tax=Streptomyces sp. NPDC048057 TaxID=3155628 RepID=UPI00341189BC